MTNKINPAELWQVAVAAFQNGQLENALRAIKPLLNHNAANSETFLLGGLIYGQLGEWAKTKPLLQRVVEETPDRVEGWLALGNAHHMLGEMEDAIASFNNALHRDSQNGDAWNNLGVVNEDIGRFRDALDCYDESLKIQPDHALALRSRASVLGRLRLFDKACHAYEGLLKRFPRDQTLVIDYAEFLEQANRPEDAKKLLPAENSFENKINEARGQRIRARLLVRDNDFQSALTCLQSTRKNTNENYLSYQEGIVLDRLAQYENAFSAFKRANQFRAKQRNFRRVLDQPLSEYLNHKINKEIINTDPNLDNTNHRKLVFLTGLPRSGTTLIDRMLDAHPDIQVLEELEGLRMTETATAEGASIIEAQQIYYDFVSRHVELDDKKLIVDKNPLHVMHLDMLSRIFPQALVVLVIRHPYDAALSCYMQDFDAGPVTARFLELNSTAQLCSQFLKLMRKHENARPKQVTRIYYENLVKDFRSEVTELLKFIGLEWHQNVEQYVAQAASSDPIMTASYEQVTRKLYETSVSRWKNYQQWLKPFHSTMGSLLKEFGYTSD